VARITIRIKAAKLGVFERHLQVAIERGRLMRVLQQAGNKVLPLLKAGSINVRDTGQYQTGWTAWVHGSILSISNRASHFPYVEGGRRPGGMPPIDVIRDWVLRHGMQANAAFPVARAIARRGIKARPFFILPTTQAFIEGVVFSHLTKYYDFALGRAAR
jgi:hypothetical protein